MLLASATAQAAVQAPTFSVEVEAVYVDVFVTHAGRPVTGLTQADFELRDSGRRRDVELVAVETLPLRTFLVFDTSGSVDGAKLAQLQAAGLALLRGLRPGDEAALLTFGHEIAVRVRPTPDLARLERGLRGILPGGSTALWDALYAGTLLAGPGRSLLVLFTDGQDNLSWLDAAELRRVLEQSNVLVQAVGLEPPAPRLLAPGRTQPPPVELPYLRTLRQLAELTGGRFWPASSPDRLADAFGAIADSMRTRYVLRFEPMSPGRPGLHPIDVRLVRRSGRVHCRRAYFVGPASR
jgi:VWFA-related protein